MEFKFGSEQSSFADGSTSTKSPEKEIHTSDPRSLKLQFRNKICSPVLTGERIQERGGASITVAVVDCLTEQVVKSGPEALAEVELLVLKGDPDIFSGDDWTSEVFEKNIVREVKGKKNLLQGSLRLNLKEGVGSVGETHFTHNKNWFKNCQFRLGARVVNNDLGIRVKEAKTDPFDVKDKHKIFDEKHYPPSLCDEVWRLKEIGKKGARYERLSGAKITTVKDFLTLLSINPRRLQEILKAGDRTWKIIIEHARTCLIGKGMYVYYNVPNSQEKTGVLFDVEGVPVGLLKESQWVPLDKLSENEKDAAHRLVESASEHWEEVLSYDDESFQMHGSIQSMHSSRADSSTDRNLVTSPMIDDPEINTDGLFVTDDSGQVPYSPIYTPEPNESWMSFLIKNLQSESPFLESHANQETDANYFPLIDPGTVHRVRRRWIKLYCWTQWFSVMKRVGALEKAHVQKKQRIY